jgi:class 3 adenylate cyclase
LKESVQPEGERRLAAIMFTDMVGFTALAQRDEAAAMELLEEQRSLIRPILAKYKGREVKTIGDAFLVEFASALEAVRCGVEIQSSLQEANAKHPDEKKTLVRIGIHLGDVIHTGSEVAGDAVNIASRIEPLALPGGVCVTEQVYASVVNKVEYQFETLSSPELKNVSLPIEEFSIVGMERSRTSYVPSYWIAVIYNGLKDTQQVVTWMQKAFEERSSWLVWSNVEPRFAWLKDDPGFASLLNAMKFP